MTEVWIDRNSPLPLHEQCKRLILDMIERGLIGPGGAIPPERTLCEQYGLSRTTVRSAVSDLVQQGVLQRAQGSGTFVTRRALPLDLHSLTSFTEDMRARGKVPSSCVVFAGLVQAEPGVATALAVIGKVMKLERVRFADDQVMGIHTAYLPEAYAFSKLDLQIEPSLHNLLARKFHVQLATAEETLEAVMASEEEARFLDISAGTPVLRIERTSYDNRGEAKEFCIMRYRADQYKYFARLVRK